MGNDARGDGANLLVKVCPVFAIGDELLGLDREHAPIVCREVESGERIARNSLENAVDRQVQRALGAPIGVRDTPGLNVVQRESGIGDLVAVHREEDGLTAGSLGRADGVIQTKVVWRQHRRHEGLGYQR